MAAHRARVLVTGHGHLVAGRASLLAVRPRRERVLPVTSTAGSVAIVVLAVVVASGLVGFAHGQTR